MDTKSSSKIQLAVRPIVYAGIAVLMLGIPGARASDKPLNDLLPQKIKTAGVIRMGGAFESLPQLNANPQDARKPVGIAPDLATLMEPLLGVKIEWVNTAWPGQIPGVQAGSFDALMGQISITAEREKGILDFVPYFRGANGIIVQAGNPSHVAPDVRSLCGLRIGAPSGSLMGRTLRGVSEKYCVAAQKPPVVLAEYPSAPAASTSVLSGQIAGYLDSSETARGIAAASGGKLSHVTLLYDQTKEWDPGLYGIATAKENTGLHAAFLGALRKLVADGSYATVMAKYGTLESKFDVKDINGNPLTNTPAGTKQ